jgi:hypothetical protein
LAGGLQRFADDLVQAIDRRGFIKRAIQVTSASALAAIGAELLHAAPAQACGGQLCSPSPNTCSPNDCSPACTGPYTCFSCFNYCFGTRSLECFNHYCAEFCLSFC